MIEMLTKKGHKIKTGCTHTRGLLNKVCVDCGAKIDFRKVQKEKVWVYEDTIPNYAR